MIGIDTNVLVRLLVGDDVAQLETVRAILASQEGRPIMINLLVLTKAVWVLGKLKRPTAPTIPEVVEMLLASPDFLLEARDDVVRALEAAGAAKCDLADALIACRNRSLGCDTTVTFDHAASRLADATIATEFS
ncbi:PIN domain-containing protein [Aureimonas glaciei]|uniref:Ribonuclease VapC n=1 Tax=Aureimonas glaciei TaxID=1776957 RepID=A0A917D738_9HYPH|nr:type II toxin-antitoxin system VapC family toxin [Aureimonas glaciei]GGD09486.1 hypothetical protein GCM10011335_10490 [Aureimonas glaciei]